MGETVRPRKKWRCEEICDLANVSEGEEDLEEMPEEVRGWKVEKIRLEESGDVIKKMADPSMPTEEEVERHRMEGHVEYRNWCSTCVRTRGKALDHKAGVDKERRKPEYAWDTASLAMKWASSGQS